jgi:ubiquitin C-terminal hydrolase
MHICLFVLLVAASLLRQLWLRPYPAALCQPTGFRRVLGKLNADYGTFQQQDAHDLLAFVLDKLHEDVNLVIKKPYIETSEVITFADEERVGRENWEKHLLRHNRFCTILFVLHYIMLERCCVWCGVVWCGDISSLMCTFNCLSSSNMFIF